ncbi:adenosylcobinamide-phosphate synthase CbiB [Sphingomonas sp.]|uniref:adenosylcobinamide-phosphate synthase CbiB n=1 Tax=Sphingomonas sp. TaxID=28214 RepID=UPI002ED7BB74
MPEPVALAALAIDAAVGWPAALYRRVGHPVGGFAAIIRRCAAMWNASSRSPGARRVMGLATVAILTGVAGGTGWLLTWLAHQALGGWSWIGIALFAAPGLAQRSLFEHVGAVRDALGTGDIEAARSAVAMIVGRDVETLDEAGVARAAIESLAESFCDGIAAPLFWLLVLGLPGLWIYKAINTADSLIGHREPSWRAFGCAAARADDLLNLVPARIAGALICLAALRGWRVMWRDAREHASPNAGWTEAAMAGALGLKLAGPASYDGETHVKPWIGDGRADAGTADVTRALSLYLRACALLWLIAGVAAWAR